MYKKQAIISLSIFAGLFWSAFIINHSLERNIVKIRSDVLTTQLVLPQGKGTFGAFDENIIIVKTRHYMHFPPKQSLTVNPRPDAK
ncbi:hypothetical protein [Peribacillus alkalitolerans]|uniref:hypothetical protein n=1 Tax=Peribacillus alkalitolerans TaxID=1550385 RepID=UPI0013D67A83|nr:hypothetical protein [Peribacillus alkalitolerans]